MSSIHVEWLDDTKTALIRSFDVGWNWGDFYESQKEVAAMMKSVDHVVNQIFDFSKTQSLPPSTMTHLRNSAKNMPDNRGASIVVTNSSFYLAMYRVLEIGAPGITSKVILTKNLEEAMEKLQDIAAGPQH